MSSSSLQQVLLPCTGCNAFLSHENSISTPTLGRARSTRRHLLLRFSVHSQLHYTHQRHLQYTALLPRAHTVETDAVPRNRDHGSFLGGQREKLWREFFLDPSQWWDHRSEKVTEHKSCQSSYVNGAITLVGVNVVALSWLKANERYPDFKHKKTEEALWVEDQ